MLIKNKESKDYTELVKLTFNIIKIQLGYTARITDIWRLLKTSLNIDKFELLDLLHYQNGEFESYLIDQQIAWLNGEDVNFSDIYNAILTVGTFTESEKLIFSNSNIEEILWGIMLAITSPESNL